MSWCPGRSISEESRIAHLCWNIAVALSQADSGLAAPWHPPESPAHILLVPLNYQPRAHRSCYSILCRIIFQHRKRTTVSTSSSLHKRQLLWCSMMLYITTGLPVADPVCSVNPSRCASLKAAAVMPEPTNITL